MLVVDQLAKQFAALYKTWRFIASWQETLSWPLTVEKRDRSKARYVGRRVKEVAVGQAFSEYFSFPLSVSSTNAP
jgi:hypothetical protein